MSTTNNFFALLHINLLPNLSHNVFLWCTGSAKEEMDQQEIKYVKRRHERACVENQG